jgi:hypothetical protein
VFLAHLTPVNLAVIDFVAVRFFGFLIFFAITVNEKWGDRRGLNPRQPESQSGALPTELRPPQNLDGSFIRIFDVYVTRDV